MRLGIPIPVLPLLLIRLSVIPIVNFDIYSLDPAGYETLFFATSKYIITFRTLRGFIFSKQ